MTIHFGDSTSITSGGSLGKILQVVQTTYTGTATYYNIGQGGETGIPFYNRIFPSSTSSKILVLCQISMDMSTTHATFATLKRRIGSGSYTEPFVGDASGSRHRITSGQADNTSSSVRNISFMYVDTPNTTTQCDYGFTMSHNDNNTVHIYVGFSAQDSDHSYNPRSACSIICAEIAG